MKYIVITLLSLHLLHGGLCMADNKLELLDEKDQINYSIGYQVGGDLRNNDIKLNDAALVQGLKDGINDSSHPLLTKEEMSKILINLKTKIDARDQKNVENYRGEGRQFLADNAKKEGVVILPSGLQYIVIHEGNGKTPKPEDTVTVKYRGTLTNGKEFDSSFRDNKPATFRLDSVIRGWQEGLSRMKEGGKWKLFIPSDLAFGEKGPLADKVVIYEIELISVKPEQDKP